MTDTRNITLKVDVKALACVIVTAVEQGIHYWARNVGADENIPAEAKRLAKEHDLPAWAFAPTMPIGYVTVDEYDDESREAQESEDGYLVTETHYLNLKAIEKGLNLMASNERYAHRLGSVFSGEADAEDADVFMQLCLLGEVRYG